MKQKLLLFAILALLFVGCKKETEPTTGHVKIQIDYLDDGGFYNDNIDGVPYNLTVGTNGPFEVALGKNYSMQYKPSNAWQTPARIDSWSPTANVTWVIHCYVQGNTAYIETYPE